MHFPSLCCLLKGYEETPALLLFSGMTFSNTLLNWLLLQPRFGVVRILLCAFYLIQFAVIAKSTHHYYQFDTDSPDLVKKMYLRYVFAIVSQGKNNLS